MYQRLFLYTLLFSTTAHTNPLAPVVAIGTVPYKIGRWAVNTFTNTSNLESKARDLLTKLDARYGKLTKIMEAPAVDRAQFVQAIGYVHQEYMAHESNLLRFARRNSCCSDYDEIKQYPFLHVVNRTQAILAWVIWYQDRVKDATLGSDLVQCERQLCNILAYAQASEEYAQEQKLIAEDRSEARKSTLYFLLVKLPILGAAVCACGMAFAGYYLYRTIVNNPLVQQARSAWNDLERDGVGMIERARLLRQLARAYQNAPASVVAEND
jgi:hypothetical protein